MDELPREIKNLDEHSDGFDVNSAELQISVASAWPGTAHPEVLGGWVRGLSRLYLLRPLLLENLEEKQ